METIKLLSKHEQQLIELIHTSPPNGIWRAAGALEQQFREMQQDVDRLIAIRDITETMHETRP